MSILVVALSLSKGNIPYIHDLLLSRVKLKGGIPCIIIYSSFLKEVFLCQSEQRFFSYLPVKKRASRA